MGVFDTVVPCPEMMVIPPLVAPPVVDEALCVSLDEDVSVEKPESCMTTLPLLPSPLFGSFLPLCELLLLRISDDDECWWSSAEEDAAAAAAAAAAADDTTDDESL